MTFKVFSAGSIKNYLINGLGFVVVWLFVFFFPLKNQFKSWWQEDLWHSSKGEFFVQICHKSYNGKHVTCQKHNLLKRYNCFLMSHIFWSFYAFSSFFLTPQSKPWAKTISINGTLPQFEEAQCHPSKPLDAHKQKAHPFPKRAWELVGNCPLQSGCLPHGASCRGHRRCRQAHPPRSCATGWWLSCGSWHRTSPAAGMRARGKRRQAQVLTDRQDQMIYVFMVYKKYFNMQQGRFFFFIYSIY